MTNFVNPGDPITAQAFNALANSIPSIRQLSPNMGFISGSDGTLVMNQWNGMLAAPSSVKASAPGVWRPKFTEVRRQEEGEEIVENLVTGAQECWWMWGRRMMRLEEIDAGRPLSGVVYAVFKRTDSPERIPEVELRDAEDFDAARTDIDPDSEYALPLFEVSGDSKRITLDLRLTPTLTIYN